MKLYIVQYYDPEQEMFVINVWNERIYINWLKYENRYASQYKSELIKIVDLTEDEASKIKVEW
jgi:hypothetical protein